MSSRFLFAVQSPGHGQKQLATRRWISWLHFLPLSVIDGQTSPADSSWWFAPTFSKLLRLLRSESCFLLAMWVGFSSGINLQELRPRAESCRAGGAPTARVAHPRGVGTRQTPALCLALVLNADFSVKSLAKRRGSESLAASQGVSDLLTSPPGQTPRTFQGSAAWVMLRAGSNPAQQSWAWLENEVLLNCTMCSPVTAFYQLFEAACPSQTPAQHSAHRGSGLQQGFLAPLWCANHKGRGRGSL